MPELTLVTGPPGSGKTYWIVVKLVTETLPNYPERKVLSNVPLFLRPEWAERCTIEEFPRGWLPPGDTLEERLEFLRDTTVIIDEAQEVFENAKHEDAMLELVSKARKRGTEWVYMSQTKDNFPKRADDMAELWIESANGGSLRDPTFGFKIRDVQNVLAKFTGKFREYFCKTEYIRRNRRWSPLNKEPYREWFRPEIGDAYDTKNGAQTAEDGRALVVHDYQRFGVFRLLWIVALRNKQCIPYFLVRVGTPFAAVGVGLLAAWYGTSTLTGGKKTPPVAVVTPAARAAVAEEARKEPEKRKGPDRVLPPALRRVVRWGPLVLALMAAIGCKSPAAHVPDQKLSHVGRALQSAIEPQVAAYGAGHSLDELLRDAGLQAETGVVVDGPLVGREVIDAAGAAGFEVQGKSVVPARKRAVPVPAELGPVDGASTVGGFAVKLVGADEVAQWRELSAVVHEAYSTELLVLAVASSQTRELSGVMSGSGVLTVSQPAAVVPFAGKASVVLTVNGSQVSARELARPVLTSAPGAEATVHVGQRIPVRLATSPSVGPVGRPRLSVARSSSSRPGRRSRLLLLACRPHR